MGESSIDQITSHIDYKILGIIFAFAIGYQISLYYVDPDDFHVPEMLYLAGIAGTAVAALIISKRYWGSQVFGRAYFFLGLGFISWLIADIGWVYDVHVLDIDPYPSPFDVGFLASYVFACFHLVLNIRYFGHKFNIQMKVLLVALPIAIVATYIFAAYQEWGYYEEIPFDLFYGSIFVTGAAITLSLAILGISVFRQSVLGNVWLLLVIGIFIWTINDVWYHYTEVFGAFDNTHPTNTLWMVSFMIIIYALYKHKKAF